MCATVSQFPCCEEQHLSPDDDRGAEARKVLGKSTGGWRRWVDFQICYSYIVQSEKMDEHGIASQKICFFGPMSNPIPITHRIHVCYIW